MEKQATTANRLRAAARRVRPGSRLARPRDEEGNLILVIILLAVLSLLVTIAVAALIPSFGVAQTSQTGEQAVAQANAGVSDALFQLDQQGDNITSFCVGAPPAALLTAAGITPPCYLTGTTPVAAAPGLQYYVVSAAAAPVGVTGITQQLNVTSVAVVKGQQRTVTALIYRIADSFAAFGVSGFVDKGALSQATVYEVGGFPANALQTSSVDVGVGSYGNGLCTGNSSGSSIATVGENGSVDSGCPAPTSTSLNIDPVDPTVCGTGQVSTAFAPCINTSSFATSGGQTYCPLSGTGIPNTVALTTSITPPSNGVYNCATSGAAVTVGSGSSTMTCTSTVPLPFGLATIPPGSYYFDTNKLTIADLDPSCFNGGVSIFDLPQACGASSCPEYIPSAGSNLVEGTNGCSLPPSSNSAVSLILQGQNMNASSPSSAPLDFTPGNPSNLAVYWSGNSSVTPTKQMVFDGSLYAPGAIMTFNGSGYETFGTLTANCLDTHGGPNLYLVYPEHANSFIRGWTVANYTITP